MVGCMVVTVTSYTDYKALVGQLIVEGFSVEKAHQVVTYCSHAPKDCGDVWFHMFVMEYR